MTHQYTDVDFKNNLFEYPDLTRIIGEPTTATLLTLRNEVKANAQAVHTTLGGGEHGHLGLVCSPETYATLVPGNTPYIKQPNPGRLIIDGTETQYQIAQRREEHAEALRLFKDCIGVERAIIQQIVAAVEPKYLKALRNPVTNKITQSIPDIFTYLFETYGDVTPQELRHLTTQVESMSFPPNEPVDTIFTEIDDLGTIAELARAPMTEQQKINMAYLLLQNAQVYSTALNKWNQKGHQQQTWNNFRTHFRDAQKSLRRTGSLTVQESLNHAELLDLVKQGVQQAMVNQSAPTDTPPPLLPANMVATCPPALDDSSTQPSTSSANSIASDLTMQTIQQQMEMMKQMMEMMKQQNNKPRRQNRRKNLTKYCHTHGLCNHNSAECRTPADGHKNEATLQNRMGGSVRNIT